MTIDETHHVLLKAAAESHDQLITRPAGLNARTAKTLFAKLRQTASAAEVVVADAEPHWHTDERGPIGLRLTTAGREILGLDPIHSEASPPVPKIERRMAPSAPRSGTKQALIIAMLRRDEGASLDDLMAATGWLAHSTRAALTGLRKRGLTLSKGRDSGDRTVYRLACDLEGPTAVAVIPMDDRSAGAR